jgi:hypothetical protein
VQPVLKRKIFSWDNSTLSLTFRNEYIDYNVGQFESAGRNMGDDVIAISPAISFRPFSQTVIRFDYRYEWRTDFIGNPPSVALGFLLRLSSYF